MLALVPAPVPRSLTYAPAPVDNSLKGLVPYVGADETGFPHSMEFDYFPLSSLVKGEGIYDWHPLDTTLKAVAARGKALVFRVFLEYPGRTDGIPPFLVAAGLRTTRWTSPDGLNITPDYRDPRLRRTLKGFVAALGERYDRDPRVAYLTAGLLGSWGEWHTYPREDLYAPPDVEAEVRSSYARAFRHVPVLLRYPLPANAGDGFGYHDDSFAYATLPEGTRRDWAFLTLLKRAGPKAESKWRTHPIGGENRPELWGRIFDPNAGPDAQPFRRCVEATHATWLMDSGVFDPKLGSPARRRRAEIEVRRMGYELHVSRVSIGASDVRLRLENRGVAPFYRDWPAEWGLLSGGRVVAVAPAKGKIRGLLPGASAEWRERLSFRASGGRYILGLRVRNPMLGGPPIGWANSDYGKAAPGWLSLGTIAWSGTPKLPRG